MVSIQFGIKMQNWCQQFLDNSNSAGKIIEAYKIVGSSPTIGARSPKQMGRASIYPALT